MSLLLRLSSPSPFPATAVGARVSTRLTKNHATSVSRSSILILRAALDTDGPRRRLVDIIRTLPELSNNYFRRPSRRALFGGISLLGGFYVAQTISLSFGALGVNDVIAAVLCVLVTEYVTKFYYSRPKFDSVAREMMSAVTESMMRKLYIKPFFGQLVRVAALQTICSRLLLESQSWQSVSHFIFPVIVG